MTQLETELKLCNGRSNAVFVQEIIIIVDVDVDLLSYRHGMRNFYVASTMMSSVTKKNQRSF